MDTLATRLTDALRGSDDAFCTRLRQLLHERGIDPHQSILAESFPDDARQEFGIVITRDERVFRFIFEWPEGEDESQGTLIEWTDLTHGWEDAAHSDLVRAGMVFVRQEAASAKRDERKRRVAGHEEFVSRVSALLFSADPIGINFEENTDEYDAEAQCIVIELHAGASQAEFLSRVHKTFIEWFSPELAGPESRYVAVSEQIWDAWCSYRPSSS